MVPPDPVPKGSHHWYLTDSGLKWHSQWGPACCSKSPSSPVCLSLQEPVSEGTVLTELGSTCRVEGTLSSQPPSTPAALTPGRHSLFPVPCPSPIPARACSSTPMPSHTPELGQVLVRQADITDRHSQTWKLVGTMGPAAPPAPLGSAGAGPIPAGSRQLAGTKFPRNLMNAMHSGLPILLSNRGHSMSAPSPKPSVLSKSPQPGRVSTAAYPAGLVLGMLVPFMQQHLAQDTLGTRG